jgi:hypothetical protein
MQQRVCVGRRVVDRRVARTDREIRCNCLEGIEGHLTKVALTGSDREQSKVPQLGRVGVPVVLVCDKQRYASQRILLKGHSGHKFGI